MLRGQLWRDGSSGMPCHLDLEGARHRVVRLTFLHTRSCETSVTIGVRQVDQADTKILHIVFYARRKIGSENMARTCSVSLRCVT